MIIKELITVNDLVNLGPYIEYFETISDLQLEDMSMEELAKLRTELTERQTDNIETSATFNNKVLRKIIAYINKKYLTPKREATGKPVLMEGTHKFNVKLRLNKNHIECLKRHDLEFPVEDIVDPDSFFQLCYMGFYLEILREDNTWFMPTQMYTQFMEHYTL